MRFICYRIFWLSAILAGLAACAPASPTVPPSPSPTRSGVLIPYNTPTIGATSSPLPPQLTPTPLPSPTLPPLTHIVKKGEDLGGIAFNYGITLDLLLKANPKVNPRAMSVGTTLIIPVTGRTAPTVLAPTPTPIPLALDPLVCYPTQEGGLWCFLPAHNNQAAAIESLSGWVRVAGTAGKNLEAAATSPLNLLPSGASLPLVAYFPPPLPDPFQASAGLISALPAASTKGRYIPAHLDNQKILIDPSSLSAQVNAEALLDVPDAAAATVWVAAVAYDAQNRMVGVRRWENQQPLASGKRLSVHLIVYSLAGPIQRVETLIEARP